MTVGVGCYRRQAGSEVASDAANPIYKRMLYERDLGLPTSPREVGYI